MSAVPGLPAASVRATVAVAAAALAAVGVPETVPSAASMESPGGRPVADHDTMSVSSVTGSRASTATPTWSVTGGVQVAAGAVRSTASVRATRAAGV